MVWHFLINVSIDPHISHPDFCPREVDTHRKICTGLLLAASYIIAKNIQRVDLEALETRERLTSQISLVGGAEPFCFRDSRIPSEAASAAPMILRHCFLEALDSVLQSWHWLHPPYTLVDATLGHPYWEFYLLSIFFSKKNPWIMEKDSAAVILIPDK